MTNAIVPFDQIEKMAAAVSKSGLFGMKTPEQALALMLLAQAEGMHPAIAARDFHVIQNRPALKADAMLARFQAAGGRVVWNTYTDQEVSGTFSHPAGGSVTVAWTIGQAKAAGLAQKDVWKQYPRAMLRARVISEGIRTVYPGVSVGVYTPEELADFDAKPAAKEIKSEVVVEAPAAPAAYDKIKSSDWTKSQLAEYCSQSWGFKSAKDLTPEQLEKLAYVCTTLTFQEAVEELYRKTTVDGDITL